MFREGNAMSRIAESAYGDRPLAYPTERAWKESGTSKDAAKAIVGDASILRERAYAALAAAGSAGLTADQVALALGRDRLSVRPRITKLAKIGRVIRTGERRQNESGLSAAAWRIVP